jgi:hypothetical protein
MLEFILKLSLSEKRIIEYDPISSGSSQPLLNHLSAAVLN